MFSRKFKRQLHQNLGSLWGAAKQGQSFGALALNGIQELHKRIDGVEKAHNENFRALENNGVATAINSLNDQVLKDRVKVDEGDLFGHFPIFGRYASLFGGYAGNTEESAQFEPTLKGKVDAIVEHLGLDFNITETKTQPSKVVAKKVQTKKKGRR